MTAVLGELLPLILGAALAPLWIVVVLLMLASPGGVVKASAFVLGVTCTRLAQGLIFGSILGASAAATEGSDGKSPVVATLLLVIGILLLIAAFRKWRKEHDPDDPPPQWMQSIDQMAPLRALGMGALLVAIAPKLWVFTLSALSIVSAAGIGRAMGVAAYLSYILLAQSLLILAILAATIAPRRSRGTLQRMTSWLTDNNRPIAIGASLVFGLYFSWGGLTALLAS